MMVNFVPQNLLEQAVESTPDVQGNFKQGLTAIKHEYRNKFDVVDSRKIGGSLDIDSSTKNLYPQYSRWDYAVEYNNEIYFVEIHPGRAGEIDAVIKKLEWLKWWLRERAPRIATLKAKNKPAYYWLFSGKNYILPDSKDNRRLRQRCSKYGLMYAKKWEP